MSCKYNNCKLCGYKSECEIYKENARGTMRDFTEKEKELIANTPITLDCFDMQGFDEKMFARNKESGLEMTLLFYWQSIVNFFDIIRRKYLETEDERYFTELVRLLPSSYKIVNL